MAALGPLALIGSVCVFLWIVGKVEKYSDWLEKIRITMNLATYNDDEIRFLRQRVERIEDKMLEERLLREKK